MAQQYWRLGRWRTTLKRYRAGDPHNISVPTLPYIAPSSSGTVGGRRGAGKEGKMRMDRQPLAMAPLENHRRAPRARKRRPIGVEAGRTPWRDRPGEVSRGAPMELLEVKGEVADIRPDPGPLIGHESVQAGHHVGARAERQDIWRKMLTHRLVIHPRTERSKTWNHSRMPCPASCCSGIDGLLAARRGARDYV